MNTINQPGFPPVLDLAEFCAQTQQTVLPQYANSRIIVPGLATLEPRNWDGGVVVHAPLKRDVERILLEELARQRFLDRIRSSSSSPAIAAFFWSSSAL